MYKLNGKTITKQQADDTASFFDMSTEDYAAENNWVLDEGEPKDEPGKTNGSTETPPTEPVKNTAAGDSSSADISLESPKVNKDPLADLEYIASKDLFKRDETEGRGTLEAYFQGVDNLSFKEVVPGMDYVTAVYTNPETGKKTKSKRISFDTSSKESIASNMQSIRDFTKENLNATELSIVTENLKSLKQERGNEINSRITTEFTAVNSAEANNPELFNPVNRTITQGFSGGEGGASRLGASAKTITEYPYEKELKAAAKQITALAALNNESLSSGDVKSRSEELVRVNIENAGILKEKKRIATELAENAAGPGFLSGLSVNWAKDKGAGRMYVGDMLLNREGEERLKDNSKDKLVAIEQNQTISRVQQGLGMLIDGDELTDAAGENLRQDFKALGIFIDSSNQKIVRFEDGSEMPEEYYKAAKKAQEIGIANQNAYKKISEEGNEITSKLKDVKISLNASKRSYDLADKALYSAGLGLMDIGINTAYLASQANPVGAPVSTLNLIRAVEAKKFVSKQRNQFAADIEFEDAFSSPENFGKFAIQEISSQLPIIVTMMASGGAASGVIGASSAGEKAISMGESNLYGESDYSDMNIALKSLGFGVSEALFAEITTVPILNRAKATWVRAGKSDVVDNGIKAWYKEQSGLLIAEPLLESGGEAATTATQNLIDGVPIITNMAHSATSGAGMGLLFAAIPFMKGAYYSRFSDYAAKDQIRKEQAEVDRLENLLKNTTNDSQSELLKKQVVDAKQTVTNSIEQQENLINNNLRGVHADNVIAITAEQSKLQNEAIEVQKTGNKQQQKIEIERLREKFDFLQGIKEASLSERNMQRARPEFESLQATSPKEYQRLINAGKKKVRSTKGDSYEATTRDIEANAYEIYLEEEIVKNNEQAQKVKGNNLSVLQTKDEAIAWVKENVKEDQQEAEIDLIQKGEVAGLQIGDNQMVVVENQIIMQKRHTGAHEVGHGVFDALLKGDADKTKQIANALKKYVKGINPELYKEWEKEFGVGQFKDDETIATFLELVANKEVGFRAKPELSKIATMFGVTVQKEFEGDYNFDFKGEDDIVNFVVGLGQKIASGDLTIEERTAAAENVAFLNIPAGTIKAKLPKRSYQPSDKADLFSMTSNAFNEATELYGLDLKLNNDGTPAFTKAEWDNIPDNTKLGLGFMIGEKWRPYVKYLMNSRSEVPGFDEYANQIIDRTSSGVEKGDDGIPFLIKTYDPEAGAKLSTHIFGQVSRRLQGVINKQDGFGEITVDAVSDKPGAKELVQTETEAKVEDEGFRNLVERRIVDPITIGNIKSKINSTIRVLKTRMDAPVSKNVTVEPIINDIRLQMGKQADIDIKRAMGGVKGGELRRFLLKNKTAILQNMTTTWLTKAMPFAVQKKVDGQWTTEWKGKKIDRETTSTDNAGRTSGNELVRRLPKLTLRISDAEFLGAVVGQGGNPIRGRKEALAKAIAEELSLDLFAEALQDENSDIRQAFENNQAMLGVELVDNYIVEMSRKAERGNVKRSQAFDHIEKHQGKLRKLLGLKRIILNKTILLNAMVKVYIDDNPSKFVNEQYIKDFVNKIGVLPIFKKKETEGVSLKNIIDEFAKQEENKADLKDILTIPEKLKAAVTKLFSNENNIARRRESDTEFVANLVKAEGEQGVIDAIRFGRGHNTSAGYIGGKRKQVFSGNPDYYNTVFSGVPNVRITEGKANRLGIKRITNIEYRENVNSEFKTIENWQEKIQLPPQSSTARKDMITKEYWEKEYKYNAETADAAWTYLNKYLQHIHDTGTDVDWLMALASLGGPMKSVLKVAATPEYFQVSNAKKLTFEHLITARVMVVELSKLYKLANANEKAEGLKTLKDNYKVALIPRTMDNAVNILFRASMPSWFNYLTDNPLTRYYNSTTYGYKNMVAVEAIGGKNKGEIIGQAWVDSNKWMKTNAGLEVRERRIADVTLNEQLVKRSQEAAPELSSKFNEMIERQKGVLSGETFARVDARMMGKNIGKYDFFAPGADDFRGLTAYTFAGKGEQGDADQKFFEDNLVKPYQRGVAAITFAKQTVKKDFAFIVKTFSKQAKMMSEKVPGTEYTYDQALRVYLWQRQGMEVPGIKPETVRNLSRAISSNLGLIEFANATLLASKQGEWMAPSKFWATETVLSGLYNMTENLGRKVYLAEFIENADIIFSPENLNKMEALYGSKYRSALEDSLYRMKNGTNRNSGSDATTNRWNNWVNQSTGAIMFFNIRSAVLQTLSIANFTNWTDNNPAKQAMAFANQPQYWSDFAMIFNSAKLKERRSGLKNDVNASELANAAKGETNKAAAVLNKMLELGFKPTQIADSFAIAAGGAAFYRNRVNTYLKQDIDKEAAEKLAFEEFSSNADESQQSSDPMLVSQQQASVLGRLVLAFQNTPMQYTRLMKKAGQDIINERGDFKTNMSKILYYGALQNLIFASLQSALFAFIPGYMDDEDGEEFKGKLEGKELRVLNSMMDSLLKGSGLTGAVLATIKNTIMELYKQDARGYNADFMYVTLQVLGISPPIGSKIRKMYNSYQTYRFEKDSLSRGASVVANGRVNLSPWYSIVGNLAAGTLNIPGDRIVDQVTSMSEALDSRNSQWQRLALAMGWKTWDVGAKNEEADLLKLAGKKKRKAEGKVKAAATRAKNKKNKKPVGAVRRSQRTSANSNNSSKAQRR